MKKDKIAKIKIKKEKVLKKGFFKKILLVFLMLFLCAAFGWFFIWLDPNFALNSGIIATNDNFLFGEFKEKVLEVFAPNGAQKTHFEILPPLEDCKYQNDSGKIIFYVQKSQIAKCGVCGKVLEISNDRLYRKVKIELTKGAVVVLSGLSIVGVQKGQSVEQSSILGSVNQTLVLEFFINSKQIPIYLENGQIKQGSLS